MRKLIIILLIGITTYHLHAQSELDALRYSFLTHGGTARYTAMSGAFGALGADFSSVSTNPAGLGSYRTSSFMFSPVFQMNSTEADYKGKLSLADKINLNANNFGFVFNLLSSDNESSGWKSVGFAIGYNRLKNFNRDISIVGYNENSSRLDQFMINSDGLLPENLGSAEYVAYDTYLTDTLGDPDLLYIHPYYENYSVNQNKKTVSKGGIGEYVFALGGNYNDILQIGISFGIQSIRYSEKSTFSENSDLTDLQSFTFNEYLDTRGSGFNMKVGMILRPVEFLRLGAAFHTPTFYTLKDVYSYDASSYFRTPDSYGDYDYFSDGDGEMEYAYELYTPMRIVTSAALVLPKVGIFSADYEFVKYNKARLRADDYNFDSENEAIKELFQQAHNIRLGVEIKLSPVYIRGGASYYGSPSINDEFGPILGYSFGAGMRTKNVFVDFGYNHSFYSNNTKLYDYYNYGSYGSEYTKLGFKEDLYSLTIGFSF